MLAAERARKREGLLAATEKLLAPVIARVRVGRLAGAGPIGVEVGKVISRYKTAKHFGVTITDGSLTVERRQDHIDAEAALDGFYVLRTPGRHPDARRADQRPAPGLRTHRRPGPAHFEVARTRPANAAKPHVRREITCRTCRNFGLMRRYVISDLHP